MISEIRINIKIDNARFPDIDFFELKNDIEDEIDNLGIGEVVDTGIGMGYVNLTVEVKNPDIALPKIREIVSNSGVLESADITIKTFND